MYYITPPVLSGGVYFKIMKNNDNILKDKIGEELYNKIDNELTNILQQTINKLNNKKPKKRKK